MAAVLYAVQSSSDRADEHGTSSPPVPRCTANVVFGSSYLATQPVPAGGWETGPRQGQALHWPNFSSAVNTGSVKLCRSCCMLLITFHVGFVTWKGFIAAVSSVITIEANSPCIAAETMWVEPSCFVCESARKGSVKKRLTKSVGTQGKGSVVTCESAAIFIIGIVPSSSQLCRDEQARWYSVTTSVAGSGQFGHGKSFQGTDRWLEMFLQLTTYAWSAAPSGACVACRQAEAIAAANAPF